MKYSIFVVLILFFCSSTDIAEQKNNHNSDKLIIDLINTWFSNTNYQLDTSIYFSNTYYSHRFDTAVFEDLNIVPKTVLRDSILIEGDSIKISHILNTTIDSIEEKYSVKFYFSTFFIDSSKTHAISSLAILYMNKSETSITGGSERVIVYTKKDNSWNVEKDSPYIYY